LFLLKEARSEFQSVRGGLNRIKRRIALTSIYGEVEIIH
jgi:hypothetical protein